MQLWQTFCEARDIKFTMAVFPLFYQRADDPLKDIHDWLAAFAAEESTRWIDLLSLFAGKDERDYWVHPCDFHPNPMPTARRRIFFMTRSIGRFGNHSSIAYLGPFTGYSTRRNRIMKSIAALALALMAGTVFAQDMTPSGDPSIIAKGAKLASQQLW